MKYLSGMDRNELTYWIGLVLSFAGLCVVCSFGVALCAVGGVMAFESVVTSYYATWFASKTEQRRK